MDKRQLSTERVRKWKLAHPGRQEELSKRWAKKNATHVSRLAKEWASRNQEKIKAARLKWATANRQKIAEKNRKWRLRNLDLCGLYRSSYKAAKCRAIPSWVDYDAIKAKYDEEIRLTKETGIEHHVDHIIPLKNPLVCGLHVADNLQVLTATQNRKKNNKFTTF